MSLRNCIADLVTAGTIDANRAARAEELFDEVEASYLESLGPEAAAEFATRETLARLKMEAAQRRRQTALQATVWKRITTDLEEYIARDPSGRLTGSALEDVIAGLIDGTGLSVRSASAQQRRNVIRGLAHAKIEAALRKHSRNLLGATRNKASLVNVVRELFGETSGDRAAGEIAQAWGEAAEMLRVRYNAAGGHIAKRKDWGLPQSHDWLRVREVTFAEWRDYILPRLDLSRMVDDTTGRAFTPEAAERALRETYEAIRTNGLSRVTPSGQARGVAMANRRSDHRFLVFRDAEGWLEYQERFGEPDPFNTMMGHIDSMSRDIAIMEAMGPNPTATLRYVDTFLQKRAVESEIKGKKGKAERDAARRASAKLNTLYELYMGTHNAPIEGTGAQLLASTRDLLTAAQLGSAALSAVSDIAFQRMAAAQVGLPHWRVVSRQVQLLNPADAGDRQIAVRLGLIAEDASRRSVAQQRYVGDAMGGEIASRLADFTLRASGLSAWTQAGRHAFGMEFLGLLADNAHVAFADLPGPLRRTMERYHIGADTWDMARATKLYEPEPGATFLRPADFADRSDLSAAVRDDLTTRFLAMVQSETEFAVPSVSLRGRAATFGVPKAGTVAGELIRSVAMYKNFAVSVTFLHGRRLIEQRGVMGKLAYAANLAIGATVLGGLSLQLKEVAKGRDPRSVTEAPEAFVLASMLQGGGLGIFGDFLFSDVNRFGRSFGDTVAGPVVGLAGDAIGIGQRLATDLAAGEDLSLGGDLVNFARRYTPGASIWYLRLAYERMFLDQVEMAVDPDAKARYRRLERRFEKDTGQEYYWPPGEPAPVRLPQ